LPRLLRPGMARCRMPNSNEVTAMIADVVRIKEIDKIAATIEFMDS
jgi:hypothetical protein